MVAAADFGLADQLVVHLSPVTRMAIFNPQPPVPLKQNTVNPAGPGVEDTNVGFLPAANAHRERVEGDVVNCRYGITTRKSNCHGTVANR